MSELFEEINSTRPTKDEGLKESFLFGEEWIEPDWRETWGGMPEFEMEDARPQYKISVNFMTYDDVKEFAEKLGIKVTKKTDSTFYPQQKALNGSYEYQGVAMDTKYPICIPSKGRYDVQTTGKKLDAMGVKNYRFFVEEHEGDLYKEHVGEDHVVTMPFRDLGKGSIPARNFLWEWSREREHKRHWCLDDNIGAFGRTHMNRRLNVTGGGFFRAMESFVDRYENIAMAGPHDRGFVPDRDPRLTPYLLNSRIYSCILIDTELDKKIGEKWRGRYNEDTDLSLRALKAGLCTCLFRAFVMDKGITNKGDGKSKGAMKGGNTDHVYGEDNDYRRKFAESLKEQHPDVVEVVWKFGRWHHSVDYRPFAKNRLIEREGLVKIKGFDNFGMELVKKK